MSPPTAAERTRRSTAHASLAILGATLQQLDLFGPIRAGVRVAQKTVRHSPSDKLYDAFIALLAGAQGLVELNRRLRADPALQAAFGRAARAEQSVVQDTLDACTAETVAQMEQALKLRLARFHGSPAKLVLRRISARKVGDKDRKRPGMRAVGQVKGYFCGCHPYIAT